MTHKTQHGCDVPEIQAYANAHGFIFDSQVDVVLQWQAFSSRKSSWWLIVNPRTLDMFIEYLRDKDIPEI